MLNINLQKFSEALAILLFSCQIFRRNIVFRRRENQWMSLIGFSPPLKVWSQVPLETISNVENLNIFLGEYAPRPPS